MLDINNNFIKVDFNTALNFWDTTDKRVICLYRQSLKEFPIDSEYRTDFVVHAGLILEGEWYIEK